jgi:hypothetical protein
VQASRSPIRTRPEAAAADHRSLRKYCLSSEGAARANKFAPRFCFAEPMKSFLFFLLISLTMLLANLDASSQKQSPPKIDEIVLEATAGFELKPGTFRSYGTAFKATFQRDGMALYAGSRNVKLIGSYQGTISPDEFEKLVKFVNARDYSHIPDDPLPASRTTDAAKTGDFKPRMTTTITYEGGGQKTISRLADLSPLDREKVPKALFEIEQAILDASARIKWREVE